MTNFHAAGRGHNIVTWLEGIELPSFRASNLSFNTFNMADDDPWDWSTERVVQEFCTAKRSWQLRSASMVIPDPIALQKVLQEEQITGDSLLNDIDDTVMRNDFGLRTIGQRAYISHGISALRLRSSKYQAQLQATQPESIAASKLSQSMDEIARLIRTSGQLQQQSVLGVVRSEEQAHDDDNVSVADRKRQKLSIPDPTADLDHTFVDTETGPDQGENVIDEEQRILTPVSELENIPSSKKRKRIAPTLVTSEIDVNRYRGMPTAADSVVINDPERIRKALPEPATATAEIPVVQPGVTFVDNNGRKRLLPVWQGPPSSSQVNEDGASTSRGVPKISSKTKILRSPAAYLGGRKFAIDDLFYYDTAVGEELPEVPMDGEFTLMPVDIANGRRLYVHNNIKRFLRSTHQEFVRNGQLYTAVVPYAERLVPKYQNQSFSLFYIDKNGSHARREELQFWPEINSTIMQHGLLDARVAAFNPAGPGVLSEMGRYEESFDPSYLENKYQYLEGGDEVLTVYGHSDEENEYDAVTWKEIEEERGELTRPIGLTRRVHISLEEIEEAIDEGIDELVAKWTNKKLPKLSNRGYRLWRKSRKQGDKRIRIIATHEDLKTYHRRISNMRKEILEDVWTSKKQVLRQIPIMEVDVFAREELKWRIRILEQNVCPEKLPIPTISSKKSLVSVIGIEDGEAIESEDDVSSSDDGLGDFLVEDEPLPSTEQELHELNLADSEEESADNEDDDEFGGDARSDISMSDHSEKQLTFPSLNNNSTSVKQEQPRIQRVIRSNPEVLDLTTISSEDELANSGIVNLITPLKPRIKLNVKKDSSPIVIPESDEDEMPDEHNMPAIDNPKAVAQFSYVIWAKLLDRQRLLVSVFQKMAVEMRRSMLDFISTLSQSDLWGHMEIVIDAYRKYFAGPESQEPFKGIKGMDKRTFQILVGFVGLFEIYIDCCYHAWREPPSVSTIRKITVDNTKLFSSYYELCMSMQELFPPGNSQSQSQLQKGKAVNDEDSSDSEDEDARLPVRRSRDRSADDDDDLEAPSQRKKRKNKVYENADARDIREQDRLRVEEQEKRSKLLRANLAKKGRTNDEGRIIINEAVGDEDKLHYISGEIAQRIKKHQIEGVRFMWNQVVAGASEELMQGCLLAHTMGLGKTMQVITLLVAIAEASISKDSKISDQIPEKLKRSQTLILCPPGLIDNWMDELLTWAPNGVLGPLEKINALSSPRQRLRKIDEWNDKGGVLIIGYEMFRTMIENKRRGKADQAALTEQDHEDVMECLLEGPNIIIADEAHKMKNPTSAITQATKRFTSTSRIALTGSPLANNVEEYYTMIDWVAPNYLGPIVEFRAKYVEPIQHGLWQDSTGGERRKALKMLKVLNDTLTPKVNRADMSVLRNDLPPKKEFVITVRLTPLQKKVYSLYLESLNSTEAATTKSGDVVQATMWQWLGVLSLICNHPRCFDARIRDDTPNQQEASDADGIILDLNAPASKMGISPELVKAATRLFQEEAPDLDSIHLSHKIQILCQILDASKAVGDKVLVFSSSIPTLNFIERMCERQKRKFSRLDGKTSMDKRQPMAKDFNLGTIELFLISTNAGGLGLNLPGANRVVIFDFKWNPVAEEQAVGRAYRIGQTKSTFVYRFVAGGTFEDHIHNKIVFKMQLASRVVDKKTPVAYASRKHNVFLLEPKEVEQHDLTEFKNRDPDVLDKILESQAVVPSITKIVESETFEKDDEDKLTAEEEKEAARIFDDEAMRRTDPNKWRALQAKRSQMIYDEQNRQAQNLLLLHQQQANLRAQQQNLHRPQPQFQQQNQNPKLPLHQSANNGNSPTHAPSPSTNVVPSESPVILPPGSMHSGVTQIRANANRIPSTPESKISKAPSTTDKAILPGDARTPLLETPGVAAKKPKTNYVHGIRGSLEHAARASGIDEVIARNISQSIRKKVEERFQLYDQRLKTMKAGHLLLQEQKSKCHALVSNKLGIDDFIDSLIPAPVQKAVSTTKGDEIPNSEMFRAMARQPDRPQGRNIKASDMKTHLKEDEMALQRLNKKREARGEETIIPQKKLKIPEWAAEQIGEARKGGLSSSPRGLLHKK